MATLTTLRPDGTGTVSGTIVDPGFSAAVYTDVSDDPDSAGTDYAQNDDTEADGTMYVTLSDVDADFDSLITLTWKARVEADNFADDSCVLYGQIFDGEGGSALTSQVTLGDQADTGETQNSGSFGSLAGSKAQWNSATLLLTWDYTKSGKGDNANLRLYGIEIDGTYNVAAAATRRIFVIS